MKTDEWRFMIWYRNSRVRTSFLSGIVVVSMSAAATHAGDWHFGSNLHCGDCHVEHGIAGGDPIPGGPYSTLLKKSTVNGLCLSCHDGSDASAPDVLAPVTMYNQTLSLESAGGHLITPGVANLTGHTLEIAEATPLSSAGKTLSMTCANCHDYHGNTNFRNLQYDPAGTGDSIPIELGTDVFQSVPPGDPPSSASAPAAYERGNIGYKSGWTRWCTSCHDQVATNSQAPAPAHFSGHPSEVAFGIAFSGNHADVSHWLAGIGEGFFGNSQVPGEGVARLPFVQPTATDFVSSRAVAATNRATCISCHSSHGSTNSKALRWPYVEGGVNYLSGCQQCHNK